MKTLAIDQATTSGWAFGDTEDDSVLQSGAENFSLKRGDSPGMRFIRFTAWLRKMIEEYEPELLVYEQPHNRGGPATEVAMGFVAQIKIVCADMNVEHTSYHSGTIKATATPGKRATKKDMIKRFKEEVGHEPIDDNEADAYWILQTAKRFI